MSVDNPDARCVVEICLHIVYIVFPDLQKHGDPVVERYRQDMGRQPAFDALGQAVVHYEKILELYQQGVSTFMGCLLLLDYFLCIVMTLVGCVTPCWWAEPVMVEPTARQPTGWVSQRHTNHRLNAAYSVLHQ